MSTSSVTLRDFLYGTLVELAPEYSSSPSIALSQDLARRCGKSRYVSLGGRVYRIHVDGRLQNKSFGLSIYQLADLFQAKGMEEIASQWRDRCSLVQAVVYPRSNEKHYKVSRLHLTIASIKDGDGTTNKYYVPGWVAEKAFKDTYVSHYVSVGQRVVFSFGSHRVEGMVTKIKEAGSVEALVTASAQVEERSSVKLKVKEGEGAAMLRILQPSEKVENPLVSCRVATVDEKPQEAVDNRLFPYPVSHRKLVKALKEELKDGLLYPRVFSVTNLIPSLKINIGVECFIEPKSRRVLGQVGQEVIPCLDMNGREDIQFEFKIHDLLRIVLVDDEVRAATKVALKILEVHAHKLSERVEQRGREPCFFLEEVKKKLLGHELYKKAHRYIELQDINNVGYTVEVEVVGGAGKPSLVARKECREPLWRVVDETRIEVQGYGVALVGEGRNAAAASVVVVEVEAQDIDKRMVIAEADVREIMRGLAYTVRGEPMTMIDSKGDGFFLRVKQLAWKEPWDKKEGQEKRIAYIDGTTEIRCEAIGSLVVEKEPLEDGDRRDVKKLFRELGLGALSDEMVLALTRLQANFVSGREECSDIGISPLRGIILYGPPGTGKSRVAEALATFLEVSKKNCRAIGATELLSKWVGKTEEAIRSLFKAAREDYVGVESPRHIIILDEIDSVFMTRSEHQNAWTNSQIAELLSCMDGINEMPPNLLIIATTNRLEVLDPALLRPGRFDMQIEVSYPSLPGRSEIFEIYTARAREKGILDEKIDWKEVAGKCEQFTGAMIKAVVNMTLMKWREKVREGGLEAVKVMQEDFEETIAEELAKKGEKETLTYFM